MLVGAIEFSSRGSARRVAEGLAREAARFPRERFRHLYSEQSISLFVVERPEDKPRTKSWHRGQNTCWLIGDSNYADDVIVDGSGNDASGPAETFSTRCVAGRSILVEVDSNATAVRLTTDRLGLMWLYIARTSGGFLISTDFAALARELKSKLSVDIDTVLLELACGYSPDDRTVFNEIRLAPPGQTIELTASGLKVVSEAAIVYGDRYAGLSLRKKFEKLDDIYSEIVDRSFRHQQSRLVLSISAGYDSRYALAFLEKNAMRLPLCTFGDPDSDEARGASAVVAKAGQATDLFPVPKVDWQQWQRCIQSLGNAGMTQWSGWAESWLTFLRQHGASVIIGYLGDALSGKHLGRQQMEPPDWVGFWLRWSTDESWAGKQILNKMAQSSLNEAMIERFGASLKKVNFVYPYQQALHLDLYGRQRRWVASQPQLISRFLTPELFFYDNSLIDFWTNLAPQDLMHQNLYLSYARDRFPRLFPKNEGKSPTLTTRAVHKVVRMLRGTDGRRRPPVIDHGSIITPNKQEILVLAERVGPLLASVLDMERFSEGVRNYGQHSESLPSDLIMRAVNVMFLLDLSLE
jgi:hypothetical protein